jgi:hypothetical protein
MDNARQKLGQGFKSVCHTLWRQDALMKKEKSHLHKLSDTPTQRYAAIKMRRKNCSMVLQMFSGISIGNLFL